jgi:hypothetical protein
MVLDGNASDKALWPVLYALTKFSVTHEIQAKSNDLVFLFEKVVE